MKVLLSILSFSLLSTMWLGPAIAERAQLLSDDDLDQVTAAGTAWSVDILPTNLVLGTAPTPSQLKPNTALDSAFASVSAAEASAVTAQAISGIAGMAVAIDAVDTTATVLEQASTQVGVESLLAGKATLSAAAALLSTVPLDQHTPQIIEAANKVNDAAAVLNQAAAGSKAIDLISAVEAVKDAKKAITALPTVGGEVDPGAAIEKAVKSIQVAKKAIDEAAKAQAVSAGGSQTTLVLKEGEGKLDPVLRINFNTGNTVGSADIIPILTAGAPGQPALDLDGAAIAGANGLLPLTLIAETLMLNMNICYLCRAEKIIQNNNGYIVPIYAR